MTDPRFSPARLAGQALTNRELQVLFRVSVGWSNAQIAQALYLTEETVKTHVRRILMKLEAVNRAHSVRLAFERRLLVAGADPLGRRRVLRGPLGSVAIELGRAERAERFVVSADDGDGFPLRSEWSLEVLLEAGWVEMG